LNIKQQFDDFEKLTEDLTKEELQAFYFAIFINMHDISYNMFKALNSVNAYLQKDEDDSRMREELVRGASMCMSKILNDHLNNFIPNGLGNALLIKQTNELFDVWIKKEEEIINKLDGARIKYKPILNHIGGFRVTSPEEAPNNK